MRWGLTEKNETIEDHATGVAGEEDTDGPVEDSELWGVNGIRWDVGRHD